MGRIIAIGGGSIGRYADDGRIISRSETKLIDEEIVSLAQKKRPKLLFVPTALNDSKEYFDSVKKYFTKLGCEVDAIFLISEKLTKTEIEKKFLSSDIIYIGGGNTLKMMSIWRKIGVDEVLKKAYRKNIVLCGISAGSICWFNYGNSDSRKFTSNSNNLIKVRGIGFIDALHCPHYDAEKNRKKDLKRMMKNTHRIVAIALDNCCAIEIVDEKYRIIKSKSSAGAYKTYWKKGKYIEEEIIVKEEFDNLNDLLNK